VRVDFVASRPPFLYHRRNRLRYLAVAARYPQLRGTDMTFGPGAHVQVAPGARVSVAPGFRARPDLNLVVTGELSIGRAMFCNRGVVIAVMHKVTIGDECRVGERTSIMDSDHVIEPLDDVEARFHRYEVKPTTIGDRVLISANCLILAGASIGDDSVIAGGSVVTGDIPPGVLAAGAPARVKRELARS
jgi:acetyltransferase-like isoleucine patch superfamily enzyme